MISLSSEINAKNKGVLFIASLAFTSDPFSIKYFKISKFYLLDA
jgi:hypothetical protein